jgi:hypothetical protein
MRLRKTPLAAKELGVPYYRLFFLLRTGQIDRPAEDSSGHLIWSDADVEAARKVLAARAKKKAAIA